MRRSGILFAAVTILFFSCIDKDLLNISDTLQVHSSYSVPIGTYNFDINEYLGSLAIVRVPTLDSLYFEDMLYPNTRAAVNFSFADSFAFNVVTNPSGKVRSVEFVVLVSNGYPTEVSAQVYFLSGLSAVPADSVFAGGPAIIQAAEINDEGLVTNPAIALFSFSMPPAFISNLSFITGISIKGKVMTTRPDIQKVKFYRNYHINMHIGSRIELMFNTSEI